MKRLRHALPFLGLLAMLSGCGLDPVQSNPDTQVVLQAFLTPGAPIDRVVLRRTIPPSEYYAWVPLDAYAISRADVVLTHPGGTTMLPERSPGVYGDPSIIAQAGARYSIAISFPAGHEFHGRTLSASTTVPLPIEMGYTLGQSLRNKGVTTLDTLTFPQGLAYPDSFAGAGEMDLQPFSLSWNRVANCAGYLVGTTARDTVGTGFLRRTDYKNWLDGDFKNPSVRQFRKTSGFFVLPDSLRIDVFWVLFAYQGSTDVLVLAADANYFDYFRTAMNGPGGQSGNDADTGVLSHVKGGLGVFGSYTADTVRTYIKPEWLPSAHVR